MPVAHSEAGATVLQPSQRANTAVQPLGLPVQGPPVPGLSPSKRRRACRVDPTASGRLVLEGVM